MRREYLIYQLAYKKRWVVFSEAPLAKADHTIRYLGQYTHRVAMTNQRVLDATGTHVTFIAIRGQRPKQSSEQAL